jgi:hypothetical protein
MLEHANTARGLEVEARFAVEKHFSVFTIVAKADVLYNLSSMVR